MEFLAMSMASAAMMETGCYLTESRKERGIRGAWSNGRALQPKTTSVTRVTENTEHPARRRR